MKTKAVLISDVHYNPVTLPLADAAMRQALKRAEDENVPLIVAGDLLDTKSIIRGEVANSLISLFSETEAQVIILVGNHSLLNEKGKEHALNFLMPWAMIVDKPVESKGLGLWFIPYYSNSAELQTVLDTIPKGSTIIAHQGVQTAYLGHYTQDKSSLPKEAFADFRVISGHYHRAQDIKCGRPRKGSVGLFSYVGNPYSLNFGEASDGPKGFQILNDDGTLTFVPTNLRKHVVAERTVGAVFDLIPGLDPDDLLWLKVSGPFLDLEKLDKKAIGDDLLGHSNFKFDKIATDVRPQVVNVEKSTNEELMDVMIDDSGETLQTAKELKKLWRSVMS